MTDRIPIISLPASKSIAQRALVVKLLSGSDCIIKPEPDCEDVEIMTAAIDIIKRSVTEGHLTVDLRLNGTAMRLLTAAAASIPGTHVTLTGVQRLCERPMAPLVEALRQAGADITYAGNPGFAPFTIRGRRLEGGELAIDPSQSSQFVSALMLAAPTWTRGLSLRLTSTTVSEGYIWMTANMMRSFRIPVETLLDRIGVMPEQYDMPATYHVEPDMSAAAFFFEAEALGMKPFILPTPDPRRSLQPDAVFPVILHEALRDGSADRDMRNVPDIVPPLAVTLALRGVPFTIRGVGHLRLKECDRLEALALGLRQLGFTVECGDNYIACDSRRGPHEENPLIRTFNDHRMVMAFAVAAEAAGGLRVDCPEAVAKSFPGFWENLERVKSREGNDLGRT